MLGILPVTVSLVLEHGLTDRPPSFHILPAATLTGLGCMCVAVPSFPLECLDMNLVFNVI